VTSSTATGIDVSGHVINLSQLQNELIAAGVAVDYGLLVLGPGSEATGADALGDPRYPADTRLFTCDVQGQGTDFPSDQLATVNSVVAAHVAMRDKTDAEYSAEFQDSATTPARKQEIRDIMAGLLPREQVPM
jgi:hypothetical protein